MKFTIPRKSLIAALTVVKDAAGKGSLPLLSNVLIKAYEKSASFTCTDLDLTLRTSADAFVSEKGEATVRADLLLNLARSFTGNDETTILLETLKDSINIISERSKYKLGTLDPNEFPIVDKIQHPVEFKLPQSKLRSLLASTSFCACKDDSRPILNSSLLQLNGELNVVCTDGRRLALITDEIEEKLPKTEIVIPARAVDQLLRLLDKEDEAKSVKIIASKQAIQFQFSDTTLFTRVFEGAYPNFRQVVPDEEAMKSMVAVPIDRVLLLEALKRVELIAESCSLDFKGHSLTIRARSSKADIVGDAVETLMIPKTKTLSIKFNVTYLVQALTAVSDDQITFHAADDLHPGVFRVASSPWTVVTMPMRDKADNEIPAQPEPAEATEPSKIQNQKAA